MGYLLKDGIAETFATKYKNSYIASGVGLSSTYVSLILHRKRAVPKRIAYAFTKVINSEAEIEDYFEYVK